MKSWSDIPLQTTIDKVSSPVEKLDFPAITVCDTESLQMPRRNRWMYLEKLLSWAKPRTKNKKGGTPFSFWNEHNVYVVKILYNIVELSITLLIT